jgi:hypothetical protein
MEESFFSFSETLLGLHTQQLYGPNISKDRKFIYLLTFTTLYFLRTLMDYYCMNQFKCIINCRQQYVSSNPIFCSVLFGFLILHFIILHVN